MTLGLGYVFAVSENNTGSQAITAFALHVTRPAAKKDRRVVGLMALTTKGVAPFKLRWQPICWTM